MSDQNINESYAYLKLIRRVDKLGQGIGQMLIVAYHYKQMARAYRQLALQCTKLAEAIDPIDVAAFQVQQDYALVKAGLAEQKMR